jgi:L-ribulokinase
MPANAPHSFSIGVDYGTNSVRALIVDTVDGSELATHVYSYPSGDAGILLDRKASSPACVRR